MKKETLLVVGVALVIGFLIGLMAGQKSGGPSPATVARQQAPATGPAPTAAPQQKINEIKSVVEKDPQNRQAWVMLGHEYFDSNQFMNAIEAYDKALELDPNDADVLTDQGVMFRRLGWYDRAIGNFTQASKIDPQHATSLYNLGIVYRYDLQDFAKAIEAWSKFLEISPNGRGADQVRQEMEFLQSHPPIPKPE